MGSEKKVLEIVDFEDKQTTADKPYTRFKTNEGWMSCFDKKSSDELKKLKGQTVNCEIMQSGEFRNIKKFLGESSEKIDITPEKVGETAIKKNSATKKEMYVSYAKDCFCAIVTRISQAKFDSMENKEVVELADIAIEAVKKIEKAFE